MSSYTDRIDSLDVTLFDFIPSESSEWDKRSLLAVQRVTAKKHQTFAYLEIGSHLGGSIQPYLADDRCEKIYSIDPRPLQQPDDRSPGYVYHYEDNSSERMLNLLKGIGHGDLAKIQCIESDASAIDPESIHHAPEIAFIDGEHTQTAVMSDFRFCEQVISRTGTIVFHDFDIVHPAIQDACQYLKDKNREFVPLKLDGVVFAIFFDPEKVHLDPFLESWCRKRRYSTPLFLLKDRLKQFMPKAVLGAMRSMRDWWRK